MRREQAERDAWAPFARELGLRLRRYRSERGLTQAQVAERAGISLYSLQTYENGRTSRGEGTNPTLMTTIALAQALEVGVDELVVGAPRLAH